MSSKRTKIVVIGGGATGVGIARAAAEQGIEVVVVERGDIGSGTSGRFHGMLHSGARYAVNDPLVAAECYQENQRLRTLVPEAITDTGGLFVALTDAEVTHADILQQACTVAGIPFTELTPQEALQQEPNLNPAIRRAFTMPDGFIDGVALLQSNRAAAEQAAVPARFITNHHVVQFTQTAGRIAGVIVRQNDTQNTQEIDCDYVINAAGVWAAEVADLAGAHIDMVFDKGTMITFKNQFTQRVINRCRPEDDGDLLVPHDGVSIMGTTSRVIADPDDCQPTQEEVDVLLREGAELVPALADAEALRVYAGVRPLHTKGVLHADSRAVSRSFTVLDHANQGVYNMLSVVGGKVTLYRLMAEATMTALNSKLDQ
jgi:glycerol-3-phosphate dehydrogenase